MELLRTPDHHFEDLPAYPFAPNYLDIPSLDPVGEESIRVHYLDEGPISAKETVLLMHGEPSWSYLYRKMIPILSDHGIRTIAPDLVGFGRSDKPAKRGDYTYVRHVEWMRSLLFEGLGLKGVTLVCQDWGGLIGLRLLALDPDKFSRVLAANTGLPTGDGRVSDAFLAWQKFSQETPEMPIGAIVAGGCATRPSPEVIAAYDAPFPDESFKEGARQFPVLVPTSPEDPASQDNREAWEVLRSFDKPFMCGFSDGDPITRGADRLFIETIPGAQLVDHPTIHGGGHFLQEDKGEELAKVTLELIGKGI